MSNNQKQIGGMVFQKADLQAILALPDVLGIAFALKAPGQAENVHLDVLSVKRVNDEYIATVQPIPEANKKGAASNFSYPADDYQKFIFSHTPELVSSSYFFGYLEQADFKNLFTGREDWTEVFVCGGVETFSPDVIQENNSNTWFNFTIAMRKGIQIQPLGTSNGNSTVIDLPSDGDKVTYDEIINAYPALEPVLEQAAITVLVDSDDGTPRGLTFEDGQQLIFDEKLAIQAARLNLGMQLTALQLETSAPDTNESMSIGAEMPYFRRAIGCPPQWPAPQATQAQQESTVRTAVEAVLR